MQRGKQNWSLISNANYIVEGFDCRGNCGICVLFLELFFLQVVLLRV